MKHERSSYEDQLIADSEHTKWLKAQERLLERKKVEKELAAQGLLKKRPMIHAPNDLNQLTHNQHIDDNDLENALIPFTDDGFVICFDFILGFSSDLKECRIATSLVNGTEIQSSEQQTTQWEPIFEANQNNAFIAMITTFKFMINIKPSPDLKLLS